MSDQAAPVSNLMYSDARLGIRRQYHDPLWQDVRPDHQIILGHTDIDLQLEHISERPDQTFKIELNRTGIDYAECLPRLAELPNVIGLSLVRAPGLELDDLRCLKHVKQFSGMDFFSAFDLSVFPELERLVAHAGCVYSGFEACRNLRQMTWYFPPNKKFDYACWSPLSGLERLELFHPRLESLVALQHHFGHLEMLNLAPASRLRDISAITKFRRLEYLGLERATKIESWLPLLRYKGRLDVVLDGCGKIPLPESTKGRHSNVKFDLHKTKIIYAG